MNYYSTDKITRRISSVQNIPMKHCAEHDNIIFIG